jgi:transcription termination factor Rho
VTDVNLRAGGADTSDLTSLKVAELQALAAGLGIQGANKLRKGELVEAVASARAAQTGGTADAGATIDGGSAPQLDVEPAAAAASQVLIEPLIAEPASAEPHVGEAVLPETALPEAVQAETAQAEPAQPEVAQAEPATQTATATSRKRAPRRASSADALVPAATHVNSGATGVDSFIPDVDALLDSALASRESAAQQAESPSQNDQAADSDTQQGDAQQGESQRSGRRRGRGQGAEDRNQGDRNQSERAGQNEQNAPAEQSDNADSAEDAQGDQNGEQGQQRQGRNRNRNRNKNSNTGDGQQGQQNQGQQNQGQQNQQGQGQSGRGQQGDRDDYAKGQNQQGQNQQGQSQQGQNGQQNQNRNNGPQNDALAEGERSGRSRYRDRKRRGGTGTGTDEFDPEIADDDVLIPVAGILDVLDNYAFVRTSGYLPGTNDVYVSLGQVKKYNLRKGDAVVGAIRQPREGENNSRQKYNAIVKVDSVNGQSIEEAANRVEFGKLTPLYPQERLRLETEPTKITQRIIDLVAPIGKGQRGLIVAPPKAGKTIVMQQIANAITTNNPEVHLMVVLVDERPEEVTDMQRTVKGEVIASTFDRPAEDHTTVAELAIERAKRLVELGHDVVVLLDSITRLGRAYNLAAPASGRILSGGVDASGL